MELSCGIAPGPDAPAQARLAETLGYKRVWLFDSPALYSDVWISLARVAEATESIGIGSAVLVPSLRSVLTTASAIGTIEMMAPGRLEVAIGTGFTARFMLGQKPLTWKATASYIGNLRALLRGEVVDAEGGVMQMRHPKGFAPDRPIETPIIVGANGPKGLAVARELGDGVMCVGAPQSGFDRCTLLSMGTVMEEGEDYSSPRVFDAIGPAIAVVYHGTYEASREGVDNLPGGKEWRLEIEKIPEHVRHLAVHEDHMIRVTDLDRRFIRPELGGTTFSGTPEQLRERAAALEEAGATELLYTPMGSDIPRELRTMREALG